MDVRFGDAVRVRTNIRQNCQCQRHASVQNADIIEYTRFAATCSAITTATKNVQIKQNCFLCVCVRSNYSNWHANSPVLDSKVKIARKRRKKAQKRNRIEGSSDVWHLVDILCVRTAID